MGVIFSEAFDSVTAPALPTGWNVGGSATWATVGTENSIAPTSSPNQVKATVPGTASNYFLTYGTQDTNSGDVTVTAAVDAWTSNLGHFQLVGVSARGSAPTLNNFTTQCYVGWVNSFDGSCRISKVVAGTKTDLGSLVTLSSGYTGRPIVTLGCQGTTLTLTVQDSGNGQYLTSAGTFQVGQTAAITLTDSSISGAGYCGLYANTPGAAFTGYFDDWVVATPPPIGTLAKTLGATAAAATGTFSATASAGITLGATAAAGTSPAFANGTLARTLGAISAAGAGTFRATASASATLGSHTLAAAGTCSARGNGSATLGAMSAAGIGTFKATASASITTGNHAVTSSAFGPSIATASITAGNHHAVGVGNNGCFATAATTTGGLNPAGSAFSGSFGSGSILTGALAPVGVGIVVNTGTVAVTAGPIAASAIGSFRAVGTGAGGLGPLSIATYAFAGAFAGLARTLGGTTAAGVATFSDRATAAVTLGHHAVTAAASFSTAAHAALALRPFVVFGGNFSLYYHVFASDSAGQPIDYDTPIAVTPGLTWTAGPLSAGTWQFGVRVSNVGGGLELNLDCATTVVISAAGVDITNRPDPPTGLRVHAAAAGAIVVEWAAAAVTVAGKRPTSFHVYCTAGPVVSYATPAATVPYGAAIAGSYQHTLSGLSDGVTYSVGVRAMNSSAEETNTSTVSVVADATGPLPVVGLSGIAVT